MVIPNVEEDYTKKSEKIPFWLRIFANQEIEVEELQETITLTENGEWSGITAGGKLKLRTKNIRGMNPRWCSNP